MSKRLQVLIPNDEYAALVQAAKHQKKGVSELVREALRKNALAPANSKSPEEKLVAILKYAKLNGSTGDIDEILSQIEKGRALS